MDGIDGWNQVRTTIGPISGYFWSLHRQLLYTSGIMDPTNSCSTQTKSHTMIKSFFVLPNTYCESMLKTNDYAYRPNISLLVLLVLSIIVNYLVRETDLLVKEWTQPTDAALQPRPKRCSRVDMFFLVDDIIGWNQLIMFTGPISG